MMIRPPCKWLVDNLRGCHCTNPIFVKYRYFTDISYCDGCEVYRPKVSICTTCKHLDNTTDIEEEYCKAKQEVIGDIAMGNSKIVSCEYYNENNLKDDDSMVKVRSSCKYLDVDNDTQKFICHYTSINGGASMVLSGDMCSKCKYHEVKEQPPMKVCKYQNEQNDCIKSSQRTFACVFARCDAWDVAKARCQYFKHTHEAKLQEILAKIEDCDLTFLESMLKDDAPWTMKQISLSLSGSYDP